MKVLVDYDLCEGNGVCMKLCPEVFEVRDDDRTHLLVERPGSVEGRYHLARALSAQGDEARARSVRDEAWRDYTLLPRFQRRHERLFAWRIKPWRPAALALVIAGVVAAVALAFS